MDDWELLERYRHERSQPAFAELVARHAGLVYGVCRRRVRDAHLAEDMAQAVFLLLARRPPTRRGGAALAGWLYQTAVYACMNATRAQRIRDRHEHQAMQERTGSGGAGGAAALSAVAVHDAGPVELELAEEMDRALARLPAHDRDALLLRFYQGMTVGAVGRALGVTEDTAAKRLSRALERLRRALTGGSKVGAGAGAGTVTGTGTGAGASVAAPLSAAALGSMLTSVTQAAAPPALAAKLAGFAAAGAGAGAEAGAVSAAVEHVAGGIVLMMKYAQVKLLATVAAVALLAGGAVVTTVAVMKSRAPARLAPEHHATATDDLRRADALAEEGWALWRRQEYAAAEAKFQQAVDLVPTLAPAWSGLGWSQFHTPDHEKARASFLRCIELFPAHSAALNGLGQIALASGDHAEAERWFLQGADTAPAAAHGLARIYLAQGRWDEARAALAKMQRSGDYGDDAMFKRMLAAADARKVDDDLRAALLPRAPSAVARQLQRGWALMREGKLDDAEAHFEDALAQAPDEPDVINGLAWFRFNTGDAGHAQVLFERALQLQADHPAAMNGLAMVYKRQGRLDDAIRLWTRLVERAPQSGAAHFGLAQTYLERNEFDKALPLFEQLAMTMPDNPAVQSGLERAREGARR